MTIHSIRIKEGFMERTINFSDKVNLIFSEKNSKGKTTLVRFLLYSLGYNIPNTKNIKFNQCEVETTLTCKEVGKISLLRYCDDCVVATIDGIEITYVLPDQLHDLHKILYSTDNKDILQNILGAYYADQEKGWTLLNRGTVIGSIHFNIEELIRGLSERDCSELIHQEGVLSRELNKYRQMFSVAQYRDSVIAETGSLAAEDYTEQIDSKLTQLLLRQKELTSELRRIDRSISDNRRFEKFIAEMKLMVQTPAGEIIPVTEDNIVGFDDIKNLLVVKRKLVSSDLSDIARKLERVKYEAEQEQEQLSFYSSESMMEIFDKKIAAVPMNMDAIDREIKKLEKSLKAIRQEISYRTKTDNHIVKSLHDNVLKYAVELGIGDSESMAESYLFTSNLKELSGAVLHKTVFAFRLAYLIEIEKIVGMQLPILLDSPSGKEVDPENVRLMMDILKRDFSDHQIIIASIFKYDFDNPNVIEIKYRVVE